MTATKRFQLSLAAFAACLAGILIDLLAGGTMNWTVAAVAAALLPILSFNYKRMQAERRLGSAPAKQNS